MTVSRGYTVYALCFITVDKEIEKMDHSTSYIFFYLATHLLVVCTVLVNGNVKATVQLHTVVASMRILR